MQFSVMPRTPKPMLVTEVIVIEFTLKKITYINVQY